MWLTLAIAYVDGLGLGYHFITVAVIVVIISGRDM
jgi:hypothetical protein